MRPDHASGADVVARLVSKVARRRWILHVAAAVAAGCAAGALVIVVARLLAWHDGVSEVRIAVAIVVTAAVIGFSFKRRTRQALAAAIERVRPACRNLVVTAEELHRHPDRASAAITRRIQLDAARSIEGLRASEVVPLDKALLALVIAVGVTALVSPRGQIAVQQALEHMRADRGALPGSATGSIKVTIQPPAYSGRPTTQLADPERIEALEGSRIRFEIPVGWRVRFGSAEPAVEAVARDSGYFAFEPPSGEGQPRLIPLSVTRDRSPSVRIENPGRDLLLPDGSRTIPVAISATDDLGLQALELRYTKVSGTGEQFEFVEGRLPVALERTSGREWRADARLALSSLQLGAGDSLVYRAVARDGRPGDAGLAASDTYFVEIVGPGQVALAGVDMPPELERYAMSQQMIVMKLERLQAGRAKLSRDALVEETVSIAAEQRTVRANFVFLLGGHVEDEEVEAEQSHEIQEGRLENTARKDINSAISQMTRVEQGLAAVDVPAALPPARAAVEALQRAFGRSRYLLRALAVRSRLDPSRRLTGDLEGASDWRRAPAEADEREGEAARELLGRLLEAAAAARAAGAVHPPRLQALAESALAIDPASGHWQAIARGLLDADDIDALDTVIAKVSPEALRGAVPRTPLSTVDSPLVRAFRAERRP